MNSRRFGVSALGSLAVLSFVGCSNSVKFASLPASSNASSSVPTSSTTSAPNNLTASPNDVPALAGWYIYTPNTTANMTTAPAPTVNFQQNQSLPGFTSCPFIDPNATCIDGTKALNHGQPAEYCYELSGANGMYFGKSASQYQILKNYIFAGAGSTPTVVPTLAQVFSQPWMQESTNVCYVDGLFYYALSYLWIPDHQVMTDPNFDIQFSVQNVDDGLEVISNDGAIAGNAPLYTPTTFSLNAGSKNDGPHLVAGANTITAIWVDDHASGRLLQGDQMSYTTSGSTGYTALQAQTPSVLRGYVYVANSVNSAATKPLAGVIVNVVNLTNNYQATTDANGFFTIQGIADGTYQTSTTYQSVTTAGAPYTFKYTNAAQAIQTFYQGL